MNIEVTGPDGSVTAFPEGTPTSVMRAAMARVYGGPQTAGGALSQLSDPQVPAAGQPVQPFAQGQPDAAATAAPDASPAPLPPGGGYGPIADAAQAAAGPSLNALASDPTPVWNGRLALLGHARAVRDAAGEMAGSMLDAGVSPALAGLAADPDTGEWGLPKSLDDVTGSPPTAATWLGIYNTLPSLMETDPSTGVALADADSPLNANIAKIASHLSSAFVGDPDTGEGGGIPGYGQVLNQFGDHFSIRAAHDAVGGTLFSSDPSSFNAAWAQAQTPAEQAAARAAITGDIANRLQSGRILPGQLGAPDSQGRLATTFGSAGAQTIVAQAENILASRYGPPADDKAASAPAVTAPPTPALAIGAQPLTPTTPIAASLVQGFDPGGIASSLRATGIGHGLFDLGLGRSRSASGGAWTSRGADQASPGQIITDGDLGQASPPPLDAAGVPEVIVNGQRRGPFDYLRRVVRDLGLGNLPAAGTDLGGFADTSGLSVPINGIAAFGQNLAGDVAARYRTADSALGEAHYDLSHRSVLNSPFQNLRLDARAIGAGGKAVALGGAALPLGLLDGTGGAALNALGGGRSPSGLVGDDYYTNGLLKVAPAFAGAPEPAVGGVAVAARPDIEALFEANSLRAADEAHEFFVRSVNNGSIRLTPNLPFNTQAGRFVDQAVRNANLEQRDQLGLDLSSVRINQRLYTSDGRYAVPDIHFPKSGNIIDYSYQLKSELTPQIKLYRSASPNGKITIIPPSAIRPIYRIYP